MSSTTYRDIGYASAAAYDARQALDVYVPSEAQVRQWHGDALDEAPVVVVVHGGALVRGDKRDAAHVAEAFRARGCVVVVPNYRLTPAATHPQHAHDVAAALEWVRTHVDEYGGDAHNVTVVGHDAGAYLAALVLFDRRTYFAGIDERDARAQRLVLVGGFYDAQCAANELDARVWPRTSLLSASPMAHVRTCADAALPTLVVCARGDTATRRGESIDLCEIAKRRWKACPPQLCVVDKGTHDELWRNVGLASGDALMEAIDQWIDEPLAQ